MKAYEVNLSVWGGYKNQARKVFVKANSIDEVKRCDDVLKVWFRKDMKPEDCPCEIIDNVITEQ